MKKAKRILALTLVCLMASGVFSGCRAKNEKITVVCTIFPIYDWVRCVVGDSDGVDVKLLVSDGADLHSFQPTAKDAINIRTADIIVRVGGVDDGFVNGLLEDGKNTDLRLMEAEGVTLRHTSPDSHHSHDDGHSHPTDEHIWLSLKNAIVCVEAICSAISAADPENAHIYRKNTDAYVKELSKLDEEYALTTSAADTPRVIFADRFPFVYLTADYGIEHTAAFEGCSTDAEAGFDTIIELSHRLEEWDISYLCVTEASDKKLYDAICELNKDKQIKLAVLDSMQSVRQSDVATGTTYIGIMKKNLEVLSGIFEIKEFK